MRQLLVITTLLAGTSISLAQTPPAQPLVPVQQPAPAGKVVADPCHCPTKVCVSEPKKNTKTVYTTKCKDYCVADCGSLFSSLFGGGCVPCDAGNCGEVRTKRVLVKKTVPDCDTTQCVVKELGK